MYVESSQLQTINLTRRDLEWMKSNWTRYKWIHAFGLGIKVCSRHKWPIRDVRDRSQKNTNVEVNNDRLVLPNENPSKGRCHSTVHFSVRRHKNPVVELWRQIGSQSWKTKIILGDWFQVGIMDVIILPTSKKDGH